MEYIDIVDEKDNVIGKETRKSVHKKHQIHRGVHVFVVNKKGEILIQQRAFTIEDRPGYFDASVGGQVKSGEGYKEAAIREVKEELGVEANHFKKVCKYKSFSDRQREIRTLFVIEHERPFKIEKEQVEKVEFRSAGKIQELIRSKEVNFTDGFLISFKHYLKSVNSKQ